MLRGVHTMSPFETPQHSCKHNKEQLAEATSCTWFWLAHKTKEWMYSSSQLSPPLY